MIVLLVMMLLSALMIGFMTNIMADTRSSGVDRDETQAYAVAHAGMEKLTSDLSLLFNSDYSPNGTQISDKAKASMQPVMPGFTYTDPDGTSGYKVQFTAQKIGQTGDCPDKCELVSTPANGRIPMPDDPTTGTTIAAGPYQGFKGLVTHYNIMVTARSNGGSEVRMRRELQTVAVPVFQFGLFSESNLSFHAGADFDFGGRIHTNSNLFLTAGKGATLTLQDKVTAVGEVVRKYIDNGMLATGTNEWPGTVKMAYGTDVYRNLAANEGSVIDGLPSGGALCTDKTSPACLNDPTWHDLSVGDYNGYIRNGRTGAKRLDLPLVAYNAQPIDLIRRPPPPVAPETKKENETAPLVYAQRYYSQASLRIMLSDKDTDLTSLPQVDTATGPVTLESGSFGPASKQAPIAKSAGLCTMLGTPALATGGCYKHLLGTSLIGGWIKIERQNNDSTWTDVTSEILGYGIVGRNLSTGILNTAFDQVLKNNARGSGSTKTTLNSCLQSDPHPNAIIRLQRVKDVPSTDADGAAGGFQYDCGYKTTGEVTTDPKDYWPLALYDTREGTKRDHANSNDSRSISLNGVMYYVELDTNNLAKWFMKTGAYAAGTGNQAKNDNNGYIVYFSDRRNNRDASNAETGEFGNEDIINSTDPAGAANGGDPDPGEDVNATTKQGYTPVLDTYGTKPSYNGTASSVPLPTTPAPSAPKLDGATRVNDVLTAADDTALSNNAAVVRANRPIFFRRALKLTNGGSLSATGITGLTIASENPVYVQGNYNSTAADAPTESHIASAIIADTIVCLSGNWNDVNSFYPLPDKPKDNDRMNAIDTGYRFAAVSGKTISFPRPTSGWGAITPGKDFGDDGGAHNLLHLLEDWGGIKMYYRGSLVSFFISRQLTGIYKAGDFGYVPPGTRIYNFDEDFLLPNKLPPGTPMFRDVNTLTFRQILRPNQ